MSRAQSESGASLVERLPKCKAKFYTVSTGVMCRAWVRDLGLKKDTGQTLWGNVTFAGYTRQGLNGGQTDGWMDGQAGEQRV